MIYEKWRGAISLITNRPRQTSEMCAVQVNDTEIDENKTQKVSGLSTRDANIYDCWCATLTHAAKKDSLRLLNISFPATSTAIVDQCLLIILTLFPANKEHTVNIKIKTKTEITISVVFAATLSKTPMKTIENDPTMKTFPCTLKDASDIIINKIKNADVALDDEQ